MDIKVELSNIAVMLCTAVTVSQTCYQDLAKNVIIKLTELCLPDKLSELNTVLQFQNKPVCPQDNLPPQTFNQIINESLNKFIEEVETVEEQLQSEQMIDEKRLDELLNQPKFLQQFNNDSNIHLQMMKQRRETNVLFVKRLEESLVQNKDKQDQIKAFKNDAPTDVYKLLHERLCKIVFPEEQKEEDVLVPVPVPVQAEPEKFHEVQLSSLLSTRMRISETYMPEVQDIIWPKNPSYNNPINFIDSTASESINAYFNFTLQAGERTNLIEKMEKCNKRSKKIENVKKAIIYYNKYINMLLGIKLMGKANEKICTMGCCDGRDTGLEIIEISLKDQERLVGIVSHNHGCAVHYGFRFIIASSDC